MKEELISFDTAKLAKERGFKNGIHYNGMGEYFTNTTQSLLQKWLREKHQLSVCIDFRDTDGRKVEGINQVYYDVMIYRLSGGDAWKKIKMSEISDNYEEALEKGLQEALKLIE